MLGENMRIILIFIVICSMYGCGASRSKSQVQIGMNWSEVMRLLMKSGWTDGLVKFELEKDFSDMGGKMYSMKHSGGSLIYFSTMPADGDEKLIEMNPPDGTTMGGELRIISIEVE